MFLVPRLANRYAQAFLNSTPVDYKQVEHIELAGKDLERRADVLFYLKIPLKHNAGLIKAIDAFLARYRVSALLKNLVHLLARQNRLALLPAVLQGIARVYRQKNGILLCRVTSAEPLSAAEKSEIEHAIASRLRVTPQVTYVSDKNLIAGVRIEAGYCVWEQSVAKALRFLSSTVLEEVYREY